MKILMRSAIVIATALAALVVSLPWIENDAWRNVIGRLSMLGFLGLAALIIGRRW